MAESNRDIGLWFNGESYIFAATIFDAKRLEREIVGGEDPERPRRWRRLADDEELTITLEPDGPGPLLRETKNAAAFVADHLEICAAMSLPLGGLLATSV